MIRPITQPPVALLFSGGVDSAVLLARMVDEGQRVQPIYLRCGLVWEEAEWAAARSWLKRWANPHLLPLVTLRMPLGDVYGEHWSTSGRSVPGAETPDEAVFLPGRNLSLIAKAALWCQLQQIEQLALAPLAENPFADASETFFEHLEQVLACCGGRPVEIVRPLAHWSKVELLRLHRSLPLSETFSCIAPLGRLHCGACNKCAERQRAFAAVGWRDETRYAQASL